MRTFNYAPVDGFTDNDIDESGVPTTEVTELEALTMMDGLSLSLRVRLIASAMVYSVINSVTSSLTTNEPVSIVVCISPERGFIIY